MKSSRARCQPTPLLDVHAALGGGICCWRFGALLWNSSGCGRHDGQIWCRQKYLLLPDRRREQTGGKRTNITFLLDQQQIEAQKSDCSFKPVDGDDCHWDIWFYRSLLQKFPFRKVFIFTITFCLFTKETNIKTQKRKSGCIEMIWIELDDSLICSFLLYRSFRHLEFSH